jgi:hypothetical protein
VTDVFVERRPFQRHPRNIAQLDLPSSDTGHRRILAVLAYLGL